MSPELDLSPRPAPAPAGSRALIRCGADLVYLVEELYLRLFALTMLLTIIGGGLAILFAELAHHHPQIALTWAFAAAGIAAAAAGLARRRKAYCWLRYSTARQLIPAWFAATAVLVSGPDSPSWWIAIPLLWAIAVVSSARVTVTAATATAAAYLAGTLLAGQPLIDHGDAGILSAAVALPANTLIGCVIVEVFTRFVLRLHRLEQTPEQPAPVRVANLAAPPGPPASRPPTNARSPAPPERVSRLTSRQLEVALLTRDGLRQGEIAVCLGISPRQVERHLRDARVRVDAANTNELVAMLVTGRLTPSNEAPS